MMKIRDRSEKQQHQGDLFLIMKCVTKLRCLLGLRARGLGMMPLLSPLQKSAERNPRPPLYPLHGPWCNSCAPLWMWVCCLGGDPQYLLLPSPIALERERGGGPRGRAGGCGERRRPLSVFQTSLNQSHSRNDCWSRSFFRGVGHLMNPSAGRLHSLHNTQNLFRVVTRKYCTWVAEALLTQYRQIVFTPGCTRGFFTTLKY